MKRTLGWLLVTAMLALPLMSCVPGGYEGKNPSRPDANQVPADQLQGGSTTAPSDTTGEGNTTGGSTTNSGGTETGGS
jgi:hypothetical protein